VTALARCHHPDGALITNLPKITINTKDKSKLYGGFR